MPHLQGAWLSSGKSLTHQVTLHDTLVWRSWPVACRPVTGVGWYCACRVSEQLAHLRAQSSSQGGPGMARGRAICKRAGKRQQQSSCCGETPATLVTVAPTKARLYFAEDPPKALACPLLRFAGALGCGCQCRGLPAGGRPCPAIGQCISTIANPRVVSCQPRTATELHVDCFSHELPYSGTPACMCHDAS